jgi:hypothetical protein
MVNIGISSQNLNHISGINTPDENQQLLEVTALQHINGLCVGFLWNWAWQFSDSGQQSRRRKSYNINHRLYTTYPKTCYSC